MIKNTLTHYGYVAKSFHWLMAILFVVMFVVAYIMINIPKSNFRFLLYDVHKATGLLLLGLVALRLLWRFINLQPRLPIVNKWVKVAAKSNIVLLYLMMILMPISGFLTSTLGGHEVSFYGIFTISPLAHDPNASVWFSNAHEIFSYLLLACFVLHIIGALFHHYVLKDNVLNRMIKSK